MHAIITLTLCNIALFPHLVLDFRVKLLNVSRSDIIETVVIMSNKTYIVLFQRSGMHM